MSRIDPNYDCGPEFLAMVLVFIKMKTPIQEIDPQDLLQFFVEKFQQAMIADAWVARRCLESFKANYEEGKSKCPEQGIEIYNRMCEQVLLGFDAAEQVLQLLSQDNPNPNPLNECLKYFPGPNRFGTRHTNAIITAKLLARQGCLLHESSKVQDFIDSEILKHPVFSEFSKKVKPMLKSQLKYRKLIPWLTR